MITGILVALVVMNLVIVGGVCFLWGHQKYVSETVVGDVQELESDVIQTLQDFRESMHLFKKEITEQVETLRINNSSLRIDETMRRMDDVEQAIELIKGRMK